jgi:hypothetical protein
MYYVSYKSFRPFLSFFGDLYSKVLVICIRSWHVPNIVLFSLYICLNKKDAHGLDVLFVKLMLNPSMSQESILTIKYQPKLFIGAFRVKYFIGPWLWHVNFHQITPLHICVGFVGHKSSPRAFNIWNSLWWHWCN